MLKGEEKGRNETKRNWEWDWEGGERCKIGEHKEEQHHYRTSTDIIEGILNPACNRMEVGHSVVSDWD